MKFVNHMKDFLQNEVNITDGRLELLTRNATAITSHLRGSVEVGDRYVGYLKQGSWKYKTIIKPKAGLGFDADILVQLDNDDDIGPAELIDSVYRALRESAIYEEKTSKKQRCLRVDYAGEHHVDVVPYVASDDKGLKGRIANRRDNTWEETNPFAYATWFTLKDRLSNGEFRRVIKLLKHLRDVKGTFSVKSVILTSLIADQMHAGAEYPDTPTALRDILLSLADHLDQYPANPPTVEDPSATGQTLNHRWDLDTYPNFREKIRYYADKVDAAYREPQRAASMRIWREVFPDFGYDPSGSKALAPDGETLIGSFGIETTLDAAAQVDISCTSQDGQPISSLVPMHTVRSLTFDIATNVTGPYQVYWKVRNSGTEAVAAGDLRGEIRYEASRRHIENVKYAGDHWVEVYIVKDGVCLAKARKNLAFRRLNR